MTSFLANNLLKLFSLAPLLTLVASSGLTDRVDRGENPIPKVNLVGPYSIYRKSVRTQHNGRVAKQQNFTDLQVNLRLLNIRVRLQLSWAEAQIYCEKHEGQLATFYNYEQAKAVVDKVYDKSDPLEIDYVKGITTAEFGLDRRYWIGLTDLVAGEGKWFWSEIGRPLVYDAMWYPGQPDHIDRDNNYLGRPEHCVALWNPVFHKQNQHHSFADVECRNKYYFICERNEDKLAAQAKWQSNGKENSANSKTNAAAEEPQDRPAVAKKHGKQATAIEMHDRKVVRKEFDEQPPAAEKPCEQVAVPQKQDQPELSEVLDTESMVTEEEDKQPSAKYELEKDLDVIERNDKQSGLGRDLTRQKVTIHSNKNILNRAVYEDKKLRTVLKLAEKLIQLPGVKTLIDASDSTEIQNEIRYLEKEMFNPENTIQNSSMWSQVSSVPKIQGEKTFEGAEATKVEADTTIFMSNTIEPTPASAAPTLVPSSEAPKQSHMSASGLIRSRSKLMKPSPIENSKARQLSKFHNSRDSLAGKFLTKHHRRFHNKLKNRTKISNEEHVGEISESVDPSGTIGMEAKQFESHEGHVALHELHKLRLNDPKAAKQADENGSVEPTPTKSDDQFQPNRHKVHHHRLKQYLATTTRQPVNIDTMPSLPLRKSHEQRQGKHAKLHNPRTDPFVASGNLARQAVKIATGPSPENPQEHIHRMPPPKSHHQRRRKHRTTVQPVEIIVTTPSPEKSRHVPKRKKVLKKLMQLLSTLSDSYD